MSNFVFDQCESNHFEILKDPTKGGVKGNYSVEPLCIKVEKLNGLVLSHDPVQHVGHLWSKMGE